MAENKVVQTISQTSFSPQAVPTVPSISRDVFGEVTRGMQNAFEAKRQMQGIEDDLAQQRQEAEDNAMKSQLYTQVGKVYNQANASLSQGKINDLEYSAFVNKGIRNITVQNPGYEKEILNASSDFSKDASTKALVDYDKYLRESADTQSQKNMDTLKSIGLLPENINVDQYQSLDTKTRTEIWDNYYYMTGKKNPRKSATYQESFVKPFTSDYMGVATQAVRQMDQRIQSGLSPIEAMKQSKQSAEGMLARAESSLIQTLYANGFSQERINEAIDKNIKPLRDIANRVLSQTDPEEYKKSLQNMQEVTVALREQDMYREAPELLNLAVLKDNIGEQGVAEFLAKDAKYNKKIINSISSWAKKIPTDKRSAVADKVNYVRSMGALPQFNNTEDKVATYTRIHEDTLLDLDNENYRPTPMNVNNIKADLKVLPELLGNGNVSSMKEKSRMASIGRNYNAVNNLVKIRNVDPITAEKYSNVLQAAMQDEANNVLDNIRRSAFNDIVDFNNDGTISLTETPSVLSSAAVEAGAGAGVGAFMGTITPGAGTIAGAAVGGTIGGATGLVRGFDEAEDLLNNVEKYNNNILGINHLRAIYRNENLDDIYASYQQPVNPQEAITGGMTPIPQQELQTRIGRQTTMQKVEQGFNLSSLNPFGSREAKADNVAANPILPKGDATYTVSESKLRKFPINIIPNTENEKPIADWVNLAIFENPVLKTFNENTVKENYVHYDKGKKKIPTIGLGYALNKDPQTIFNDFRNAGLDLSEDLKGKITNLSNTTGSDKNALSQSDLNSLSEQFIKEAGGTSQLFNITSKLTSKIAEEKLAEFNRIINNKNPRTGKVPEQYDITKETPDMRHALALVAYNNNGSKTNKMRSNLTKAIKENDADTARKLIKGWGNAVSSGAQGVKDRYEIAANIVANILDKRANEVAPDAGIMVTETPSENGVGYTQRERSALDSVLSEL